MESQKTKSKMPVKSKMPAKKEIKQPEVQQTVKVEQMQEKEEEEEENETVVKQTNAETAQIAAKKDLPIEKIVRKPAVNGMKTVASKPLANKPVVAVKPQPPKVQITQQAPIQQPIQPFSIQQQVPTRIMPIPAQFGVYGNRNRNSMATTNPMPEYFNDDQPLIQKAKEQKKDAKIDISIKAQRSMIKLKQAMNLPAMCSITTSGGARTSVDLICVIDVSGSMSGQKIQLVKDTMKFLIETLTPADRLSIITFNDSGSRICKLKCVTPENLVSFDQDITNLYAGGGTCIMSGLNLALKTIRDRKTPNKVTSVFLLSDGQDKGAQNSFKQSLKQPENTELGVFSIHSFGFGTDHDEELMTKICEIKDGSFYFIKQLATLDEAFCNALGGIISLVASEITIKIGNCAKGLVQGVTINRTFGPMWEFITAKEYRIKLSQLMSGISKDYVFELGIPAINTEVGDLDRDHDVIQAIFMAKGINGENMSGECCFKVTLLNQNQQIPEVNENIDVIENYLRVKASEVIEENMKKAQNQKYEEAQKGIDDMIQSIEGNKRARKEKMEYLVNDLKQIRQKCSKQQYQAEGKKYMVSAKQAHSKQANFQYSNCIQSEMVAIRKSKKMG